MTMLKKIISGGQTGADIGGLIVAKKFGLETGGWIPKGFKTQAGPRPDYAETYGLQEHTSESYVPRTFANVRDSDATIRIAGDLESPGERCTLKAIEQYGRRHFDVDLIDAYPLEARAIEAAAWIQKHQIVVLNVAGNSESTFSGTAAETINFMSGLLTELGLAP